MSMIHQPMYIILKKKVFFKSWKHSWPKNDQNPIFFFLKNIKWDHLINILFEQRKNTIAVQCDSPYCLIKAAKRVRKRPCISIQPSKCSHFAEKWLNILVILRLILILLNILFAVLTKLDLMSHHTSVSNWFYYVVTIALSLLTDRLICIELFMCFWPKSQQRPSMRNVRCQTNT